MRVAVRGVIAQARRQRAPLAVAPLCAAAAVMCVFSPPSKQMRVVGWSLVAASVVTALILIVLFRSAGGS